MPSIYERDRRRDQPLIALPAPGLAAPGRPAPRSRRPVSRGRHRPARWRQVLAGLGLTATGAGILAGLMAVLQRFDGVLLVSKAIADLISGLSRLALGLVQLGGVLGVALLALLALLLLCGGVVRVVRALLSRPLRRAAPASGVPSSVRPIRGR